MVGHSLHLEKDISVVDADCFDCLLNYLLNSTSYYTMSVFWTENYMVINVVDTVTSFSFHRLIIPACSSYVNTFSKNFGRRTRRREIALRAMPLSSHPTRGWVFRKASPINRPVPGGARYEPPPDGKY